MSAAVQPHTVDQTDVSHIVRASLGLGVLESVAVIVIGLISKYLDGVVEQALLLVLVSGAVLAVTFLPGLWTRARSIEGIAGAAGIGLAAAWVFLVVDVLFLQGAWLPFSLYTHRWRDIGGGSNWWYHPIWWMVGTYLPWLGAWILANQASRRAEPGISSAAALVLGGTVLSTVVANLLHVPGAGWNAGTFGVAFLPGLALATIVSVLGARRK
jgi:hypothetical protein